MTTPICLTPTEPHQWRWSDGVYRLHLAEHGPERFVLTIDKQSGDNPGRLCFSSHGSKKQARERVVAVLNQDQGKEVYR